MSLRARLALARLALAVPAEGVDVDVLSPLVAAGVDFLVLGDSGDPEQDAARVQQCRQVWGSSGLLGATSALDAAEPAQADVVHVERPGWKLWGDYPRGHRWSLLGRDVHDARTVARPGGAWDYLVVGPVDPADADDPLLRAALEHQPVFAAKSLPWFALAPFDAAGAGDVLTAGARRLALPGEVLADDDLEGLVRGLREAVDAAWAADPDAAAYLRSAVAR